MSANAELVKRLRVNAEHIDNGVQLAGGATVARAADVIEEQVAEIARLTEQVERQRFFAKMASDLDRCPHGRHEGDLCGGAAGCNGPSLGNVSTGTVLGYTMSANTYVMPGRQNRHDQNAWGGDPWE